MKLVHRTLGNVLHDKDVADALAGYALERVGLDPWTAQRSRFRAVGDKGTELAVALRRNERLSEGDLLAVDCAARTAIVATIAANPVMAIDLTEVARRDMASAMHACVELGHALGNQHWPAVVKGLTVYVPLTVDRKVMQSVMATHAIPGVTCRFEESAEVLPHLSPGEVRRLTAGAAQPPHLHAHHHVHDAC